jgi:hypothetical protein
MMDASDGCLALSNQASVFSLFEELSVATLGLVLGTAAVCDETIGAVEAGKAGAGTGVGIGAEVATTTAGSAGATMGSEGKIKQPCSSSAHNTESERIEEKNQKIK